MRSGGYFTVCSARGSSLVESRSTARNATDPTVYVEIQAAPRFQLEEHGWRSQPTESSKDLSLCLAKMPGPRYDVRHIEDESEAD